MFESILDTTLGGLEINLALICMLTSIILGIVIALVYRYTSKYTKNFLITLSLLPIVVQVVIMMVNGNLGASIAVLGAFSLVRFRSIPGTSREIVAVFFAMAVGLSIGIGHILFAVITTILVSITLIVLSKSKFGQKSEEEVQLKITIPEDLNYENVFDDIFDKYTKKAELEKVKTTNLGSMYKLTYSIMFNKGVSKKEFLDEIRCRNGNLDITMTRDLENFREL